MQIAQRLFEITSDWKTLTKRVGLRSSLRTIAEDLVHLPYRHLHFILFARSLDEPFPDLPASSSLTIRPFEKADIALVQQIDRLSEARLCARRLEQGHKGFMAVCDGQPAGYTWGSADRTTALERVHPPLDVGDFLCTDSFTTPAFRGRGIQTALTLARFHLFRELGFRRAISTIEVHNAPSIAVWQRKLNSQAIGAIDFMRIGPWYRIRYT